LFWSTPTAACWEMPSYNWSEGINSFSIIFEERIKSHRFD